MLWNQIKYTLRCIIEYTKLTFETVQIYNSYEQTVNINLYNNIEFKFLITYFVANFNIFLILFLTFC